VGHLDAGQSELRAGHAAALAVWGVVGRDRLARLLSTSQDPSLVYRRLAAVRPGAPDVNTMIRRLRLLGQRALYLSGPGYPSRLVGVQDPPPVLFVRGTGPNDLEATLDLPTVAMVGSWQSTDYGCRVAEGLARQLAGLGVTVVAGLGAGAEGASLAGALAAVNSPPVAVSAGGLDSTYPASSVPLSRRVGEVGLLVSEAGPGTAPAGWRYGTRNRLIEAMADLVVVVEARANSAALAIADRSIRLGKPVLAVPGPIDSPLSSGPNQLLADGCGPARDAQDIVVGLSLAGRSLPGR
jgi:DNA processing protein